MINLETFVNEKLKVSKKSPIILDIDIYELTSHDEFNTYLRNANNWLQSFATKVPKDKSNKNILNTDDLYISIDTKRNTYALSVGYKNKETYLFMPVGAEEVMKTDAKGNDTGWRIYDTVFIVPDYIKDDVIKIINYKI